MVIAARMQVLIEKTNNPAQFSHQLLSMKVSQKSWRCTAAVLFIKCQFLNRRRKRVQMRKAMKRRSEMQRELMMVIRRTQTSFRLEKRVPFATMKTAMSASFKFKTREGPTLQLRSFSE